MSEFRLHSPPAISPSMQGDAWRGVPTDQQSKTSEHSVGTVQRASNYRPSAGSARSLGSSSSARLQAGRENLAAKRDGSHSSLKISPYSTSSSLVRRTSKRASHRPRWENDTPLAPYEQRVSTLLAEAGPLEDIDLNAVCGDSPQGRHESAQDAKDNVNRGLSFDYRTQETLSTPRIPSDVSREVTGPRSFDIGTDHPLKSENPLKRLVGTLRTQGPKRRHSLTVRKERWILDDFDEGKAIEIDSPQTRRLNGHQKASSWSSSGLRHAIKSATVRLQSTTNAPRSSMFSRARLLRNNRGSRVSNAASKASIDGDQVAARAAEHAARERAVQRRRILEELISSEESYVADLKVLLHVGGPSKSSSGASVADMIL